jgi:protein CpxP
MKRKIIAGLIAATALSWGFTVAAESGRGCDANGPDRHHQLGQGKFDPATAAEKHLGHFKDELKITAQQEPLWQAFADKVKQNAGSGIKARQTLDAPLPAPERMAQHNALLKERLAAMEASTDSFKRLYDALSPEQKKIADRHAAHMGHFGPPGLSPEARHEEHRPG